VGRNFGITQCQYIRWLKRKRVKALQNIIAVTRVGERMVEIMADEDINDYVGL
jgi:hypothetical protein